MSDDRRRPFALLRNLVLAAERRAAQEAASSAFRGAAEELREQLPDLDHDVAALADELLGALRRWVQEAGQPGVTNRTAHSIALSATRGALDELERQWREGGLPLHDFFERVNRLLDRAAVFASHKADLLNNPEERAYRIAVSVVDGVVDRLHDAVPQMGEDFQTLTPGVAKSAAAIGEGLFLGVASAARAERDAFELLAAAVASSAGDAFLASAATRTRQEAAAFTPLLEAAGRAVARGMTAGAFDEVEARLKRLKPALKRAGASVAAGFGALTALWLVGSRLRRA